MNITANKKFIMNALLKGVPFGPLIPVRAEEIVELFEKQSPDQHEACTEFCQKIDAVPVWGTTVIGPSPLQILVKRVPDDYPVI